MGRAKRRQKTVEPLVNEFAARHGDYQGATISITAGEFDGEPHGNKRVIINRGGTTLQRWMSAEQINPTQINAVNLYTRAWHRVFSEPRVTANLSPIAFIRSTGDEEQRNATKIDALEFLKHLDDKIFNIAPPYYRDVWQDVVIYDRPAYEVAGKARGGPERAKTICLFIADIIATIMRL